MADLPLFPLPLVIMPGGTLQLQIFETRYLDMVRDCMRDDNPFGIVMIEEGDQVIRDSNQALPSVVHSGTACRIIDFDQHPNGMLGITILGDRKFAIRDHYETPARLMRGEVEYLPAEADAPLPDELEHLAELLAGLLQHESVARLGITPDYDSALSVGARLTELMPCSPALKQRLFEFREPLARLKFIDRMITEMQQSGESPAD